MSSRFQVVFPVLVALFGLAGCNVVAVGHQDPAAKAEALAAFHAGVANFSCGQGLSCAVKWSAAKQSANRLLTGERWDDVADVVLGAGYEQDLTWFYLGVAAEGLGQTRAARIYYDNAVRRSLYGAGYACTSAGMSSCEGIRMPQDAQQMLAGLDRRGRGQAARGPNPAARLGATGNGDGARAFVQRLAQIRADDRTPDAAPRQMTTYQTVPVQMSAPRSTAAVAAAVQAASVQPVVAAVQTAAMPPGGAKTGGAKATAQPGS